MAPPRHPDFRRFLPKCAPRPGRFWPLQALLLAGSLLLPVAAIAAVLPPGALPCTETSGATAGYGSFVLLKHVDYVQVSSTAAPTSPGAVAAISLSPPALYSISNAIVSGPGTFKTGLTRQADGSSTWSEPGTETSVMDRIPAGVGSVSFQLGFTNGDSYIGFFPFTLTSATPPIPQLVNYDAAQAVNAQASFALNWTGWVGATTNDRVNLSLTDAGGNVVVSGATDCTGQSSLGITNASFTIPAGQLSAGTTYTGYLTFGASLGGGADDSTQIIGRSFASRTTRFIVKTTGGGSGGGSPATFDGPKISGTNLVFNLKGTPGDVQRIESSTNFVAWTPETEITIPPGGSIEVKLALPTDGSPRFYRAIAVRSATPNAEPAHLGIVLTGVRDLDISVAGTAGATYNVEMTYDGTAWTQIATATIPAAGTPVVIHVSVPEGRNFVMVRAVAPAGPPPPVVLKAPTLAAAITNLTFGNGTPLPAMRINLTDGTPRRSYGIQQRTTTPGSTWVSNSQTITTDSTGKGSLVVILNRPPLGQGTLPSGVFFRTANP